jgi:two-component system, chemotaxis family, protein-glutamate methylesterase/glutaminase
VTVSHLVVVGCSWGGLDALRALLAGLPHDLDAAMVVAQHRGASSPSALVDILSRSSPMPVREVNDKEPIETGVVYLAPADYHLLVEPENFALSVDERVQFARPSVDVLFESAADAFGGRVIAVILTGANEDGADGVRRVKDAGGYVVVQQPETAVRRSMPDAALATGAVDQAVTLDELAPLLVERCGRIGVPQ